MMFPFKGGSSCPSVQIGAPSTPPYVGASLSAGPSSSGGAPAMVNFNTTCPCSTSCCGGGGGPGGGGPGGGGPGGGGPGGGGPGFGLLSA
jgi:hypothetical protein